MFFIKSLGMEVGEFAYSCDNTLVTRQVVRMPHESY